MATKKSPRDVEAIGPSQDGVQGFGGGVNPPNPQDAIFSGPIPLRTSPGMTTRRPFSEPTRPPLHYNDGTGPDESVTSRRPNTIGPLGDSHSDMDHHENRPIQGEDRQPYSKGTDDSRTTNGVEIRGS